MKARTAISLAVLGAVLCIAYMVWEGRVGARWTLPLESLVSGMTEAEVLGVAGRPALTRTDQPGFSLGDRACYRKARSYLGVQAQGVAFFFRGGALESAKVDVPNHQHRAMGQALHKRYGPPTVVQRRARARDRLVGWKVPQGNVFYNRDRSANPDEQSMVYWMGGNEAIRQGGVAETSSEVSDWLP